MIFSRTVNDIGVLNDVINSIKKSLRLLEDLNIYIQISKNKLNGVISNFNVLLDKCNYVKEQLSIAYTSFLNIADCRTKAKNEQYSNVEDFLKEIGESIRIATKCYKDVIETAKALSKFNLDSKDVLEIDNLIKTSDFFIKPSRRDKYKLKQKIQMIFQDPASSLNERMSVEQIISEGLQNFPDSYLNSEVKKAYIEHYNKNLPIQKQINETQVHPYELKKFVVVQQLQGVGLLQQHLGRYPHEFSGGQRQRIAIARSLVIKPSFIVADEPISALDVSIRSQVLNLLKEFQKIYDLTYLFIAHDLTVVKVIADRVAVIYRGQIVELATSKELFKNPLHPYTKALLSAVPIPNPKLEKEKKIIEYQPEKSHYDYLINSPE
jgi:oligopeptide transport system ATP-binding protein